MPSESFEVLTPIGEPSAKQETSAKRVKDLNGMTICQVTNGHYKADVVLPAVGELIKKRFPGAKVIPWTEFPIIDTLSDIDERLKQFSALLREKGADAVISSTGG
jgi:hypothetical protein